MTLRARRAVAATLLVGVAATGCANSGAGQGGSSPPRSAPGSTPVSASPSGSATTGPVPSPPARPPGTPTPPTASLPHPSGPYPSGPLTEADTGRTLALTVGDTAHLRLSSKYRWTGPAADGVTTGGPSLLLVPVGYEGDPGFLEWEIRALRPGTTTVRATGKPGSRALKLTFRVTGS
ncbi:hypothetical protein [Streptomyces sp. NPDC051561]|uniref:hypothetical protein n=1 Tax=Streptomyces sp. NPDC051561 TaxID=3365658 RepID=UPI0037984E2F